MTEPTDIVHQWHTMLAGDDPDLMAPLLDDNVTFRSPAIRQPKQGKATAARFLAAAQKVIGPTVQFGRVWRLEDSSAVIEFGSTVDGLDVHDVDIITWNARGLITEITVMARPLQALDALSQAMGRSLSAADSTN